MTAKPSLSLIPGGKRERKPPAKPTPASVKALQRRAKSQANSIILDLVASMEALAAQAREVTELGDSAPVGVRDLAPRMADDLEHKAATIRQILGRQR